MAGATRPQTDVNRTGIPRAVSIMPLLPLQDGAERPQASGITTKVKKARSANYGLLQFTRPQFSAS
jgi:hypothetical protein